MEKAALFFLSELHLSIFARTNSLHFGMYLVGKVYGELQRDVLDSHLSRVGKRGRILRGGHEDLVVFVAVVALFNVVVVVVVYVLLLSFDEK